MPYPHTQSDTHAVTHWLAGHKTPNYLLTVTHTKATWSPHPPWTKHLHTAQSEDTTQSASPLERAGRPVMQIPSGRRSSLSDSFCLSADFRSLISLTLAMVDLRTVDWTRALAWLLPWLQHTRRRGVPHWNEGFQRMPFYPVNKTTWDLFRIHNPHITQCAHNTLSPNKNFVLKSGGGGGGGGTISCLAPKAAL